MNVVYGKHGTGKTHDMIRECSKVGGIIWVGSFDRRQFIEMAAKLMEIECPPIYTVGEVKDGKCLIIPISQRKVFIDDLEYFLWVLGYGKFKIMHVNCDPESVYHNENKWYDELTELPNNWVETIKSRKDKREMGLAFKPNFKMMLCGLMDGDFYSYGRMCQVHYNHVWTHVRCPHPDGVVQKFEPSDAIEPIEMDSYNVPLERVHFLGRDFGVGRCPHCGKIYYSEM